MQDDLLGRVVIGRNTPGYYYKNSTALAPGRAGVPKTEAERQAMHYARYGTTALPPRGTGLGRQKLGVDLGTLVIGGIIGFVFAAFVLTRPGREVGAAAAARAARRIRG